MAALITSVQTKISEQIPDGGSTSETTLIVIGRVEVSGLIEIKDGHGGETLGMAEAETGTPFRVYLFNLATKKYAFVATDTQGDSRPWVITVT